MSFPKCPISQILSNDVSILTGSKQIISARDTGAVIFPVFEALDIPVEPHAFGLRVCSRVSDVMLGIEWLLE